MNRQKYFDFIEEKLNFLAYRIKIRGKLNILDLNLHSENFYLHFLNLLFAWNLHNLNVEEPNAAGIDLVDNGKKIVVQVSATPTKRKIESTLSKELSRFKGYSFKFISICEDVTSLRTNTFRNPHNLIFTPAQDIYDVPSILKRINAMGIDQLKEICEFLKKELIKNEPNPKKTESNLTAIIKILAQEDWSQTTLDYEIAPYGIEAKISHNKLNDVRDLIDDHKIHYHRVDQIYSDFDKQGVNKSNSILNGIRTQYLALGELDPDKCFLSIIERVIRRIRASANYTPIHDEELELCVQILVVDAFIRCKIFKNPVGYNNADS